jgi:hypothetical protein
MYGNLDIPLLDFTRLQTLNMCFERIVCSFHSYEPIMSEIQNEYTLVINSIINILDEKV